MIKKLLPVVTRGKETSFNDRKADRSQVWSGPSRWMYVFFYASVITLLSKGKLNSTQLLQRPCLLPCHPCRQDSMQLVPCESHISDSLTEALGFDTPNFSLSQQQLGFVTPWLCSCYHLMWPGNQSWSFFPDPPLHLRQTYAALRNITVIRGQDHFWEYALLPISNPLW